MPAESNTDIKKLIRESKTFSGGEYFKTADLCTEIGSNYDFTIQTLGQMVQDGGASKKRVKRTDSGGVVWEYRKCTLMPKDFFAMSFRRHRNDELGLEPLYPWAVL
jgi:hypothetical protein